MSVPRCIGFAMVLVICLTSVFAAPQLVIVSPEQGKAYSSPVSVIWYVQDAPDAKVDFFVSGKSIPADESPLSIELAQGNMSLFGFISDPEGVSYGVAPTKVDFVVDDSIGKAGYDIVAGEVRYDPMPWIVGASMLLSIIILLIIFMALVRRHRKIDAPPAQAPIIQSPRSVAPAQSAAPVQPASASQPAAPQRPASPAYSPPASPPMQPPRQ